jgi:hypothetical protein
MTIKEKQLLQRMKKERNVYIEIQGRMENNAQRKEKS